MIFKQLIYEASQETKVPAAEIRKAGVCMLERFALLINEQQNFVFPLITLTAVTTPARPAAGAIPSVPSRKFVRMAILQ